MVVKTYLCHHKDGFKVKDKVAALQIKELWTDMMCFSSRITEEFLWKRYSFKFCGHICNNLVSGASYNRLNNASWEVLKTAVVWLSLSDPTNPSPVWAASTSFTATTCCWVTVIWFEDRGCVVARVHAKESIWMRSQHAQAPSSQFAACLLSSVFSPYTATLPYIVKSSVLLQKQTEGSLWQPWSSHCSSQKYFPRSIMARDLQQWFSLSSADSLESCWTRQGTISQVLKKYHGWEMLRLTVQFLFPRLLLIKKKGASEISKAAGTHRSLKTY